MSKKSQDWHKSQQKNLKNFNTPWKMWMYFFRHLPVIIFFRIRIKYVTEESCSISIPFGWRTQNPFKSIYAGAQFAAAEISTGLMASAAIAGRGSISMLITNVEMVYMKKAKSMTTFTCDDGQLLIDTIDMMIESGEPQVVKMKSVGTMDSDEIVSEMYFTWSFKMKSEVKPIEHQNTP